MSDTSGVMSQRSEAELARVKAENERLREALAGLGEMIVVQGDANKKHNPHSNMNLNSNEAWIVCGNNEKSAHKMQTKIEACKQALQTKGGEDAKE